MSSALGNLAVTAQIPLHCNVCPKNPDFSDVSHLLTHVASKGHLSSYFKMQVKSSTDPLSKCILNAYDEWYRDWNVQGLMAERMSQKERKRGPLGNAARRNSAGKSPSNSITSSQTSTSANEQQRLAASVVAASTSRESSLPISNASAGRRARPLRRTMAGPRNDRQIKREPLSRSATPSIPYMHDAAGMRAPYAPQMQNWSASPYAYSPASYQHVDSPFTTPSEDSSEPEERPRRRRGKRKHHRSESSGTKSIVEDDLDEMINDPHKLKGVYWKGMGVFDSATPEMRRRRNQKKATSVLQQLQASSELILPTELVFDSEHILRRERVITGFPEDSDHLEGETTPEEDAPAPKKKRGRKPRPALREKEPNTGRVLRKTRLSAVQEPPRTEVRKRKRLDYDGYDDDDDDLTYGRTRAKKRAGISVHRDNSGPDITFGQSHTQHRVPIDLLAAAFRPPFQQPQSLHHHAQQAMTNGYFSNGPHHRRQLSFPFGMNGGFRPAGNNGITGAHSFASFGQLNGLDSMLHSATYNGGSYVPTALVSLTDFPNSINPNGFASSYGQSDNTFLSQGHHIDQSQQAPASDNTQWDIFGGSHPTLAACTSSGANLTGLADFGVTNPLYFHNNQVSFREDDEATVSAPPSPRKDS